MLDPSEKRIFPRLLMNAIDNREIFSNFWYDLEKIRGNEDGPVVITASGSSLWEALDTPIGKTFPIICSQSQVCPLYERDYIAYYMTILDPNIATKEQISKPWDKFETVPIVATQVHPETLRRLPAGYVFREKGPMKVFHTEVSPVLYPWIKGEILAGGCSGNLNYALAHYLGFEEVYLAGYDYGAIIDGSKRFESGLSDFIGDLPTSSEPDENWIPSGVRGYVTTKQMLIYKTGLYMLIQYLKLPVFRIRNCGILTEIPLIGQEFTLDAINEWLSIAVPKPEVIR